MLVYFFFVNIEKGFGVLFDFLIMIVFCIEVMGWYWFFWEILFSFFGFICIMLYLEGNKFGKWDCVCLVCGVIIVELRFLLVFVWLKNCDFLWFCKLVFCFNELSWIDEFVWIG